MNCFYESCPIMSTGYIGFRGYSLFFFCKVTSFLFLSFFFFFYCALRYLFGKCVSILVYAHFLLSDKEKIYIYISTTTEHISQNLHINRLYLDVCRKNKIIITFIFFLFCNEENYSSDFYHSSNCVIH